MRKDNARNGHEGETGIKLTDIKDLFHKVIIPFHEIERDITLPVKSHRPDNDAEHSWSLTMLAISLAPLIDSKLDIGKVGILATVHDLVEINAGDTSFWADNEYIQSKPEREAAAVKKLAGDLPKFKHIIDYIHEYEARSTNEAKFVYALDKLLNLLMIVEDKAYYHHANKISRLDYEKRMTAHITKAHTHAGVAIYYDELKKLFDEDPQNFYSNV